MRVLMLGWEYPPHISGGLGTACQGISIGLAKKNHQITFVVPHLFGSEDAPHMQMVGVISDSLEKDTVRPLQQQKSKRRTKSKKIIRKIKIKSLLSPYTNPTQYQMSYEAMLNCTGLKSTEVEEYLVDDTSKREDFIKRVSFQSYGKDIFLEVERYAQQVRAHFAEESFDIIHAHDWMTVPAAVLLSKVKNIPVVLHIHSLEQDRSGAHVNQQIAAIESYGMSYAQRVIAVSHYTKQIIQRNFTLAAEKIHVVHNGVYQGKVREHYKKPKDNKQRVLFLGRITMQKGPDYFVEAAAKILPHFPKVEFIIAGAGDMLPRLKARVQSLGIQKNFYFPGFLKGKQVERAYALADVYVMPSVSEPFGIAALEAIKFDTPVIVSKQSGVSEVLSHALKVDFWDTKKLADSIINALRYPELREDMLSMAREEVKRVHWDAAANSIDDVYKSL